MLAQDSSRKLSRIIHKYVHTFTVSSFHSVGRLFWTQTHLDYMDTDSWAVLVTLYSILLSSLFVSSRLLFRVGWPTTLLACFVIDLYKKERLQDFSGKLYFLS